MQHHEQPDNSAPAAGRTSREQLLAARDPEIWNLVADNAARGASVEEMIEAINRVAREHVPPVHEELRRRAPEMLRHHREATDGFLGRLRAVWGDALDAMFGVYVATEEIGSDLQQMHGPEGDVVFDVIAGLHARACLVLREVHALLSQGFPLGALARARTLHETAVVGLVIQHACRELENQDIAVRFAEHQVIDERWDLKVAVSAGFEVDPAEVQSLDEMRNDLVERYGDAFGFDYGWAAPLFPQLGSKQRVKFGMLDELAGWQLSRFDYRLSNHHIHASARSVSLSMYQFRDQLVRLTGETNTGFASPAGMAMYSALGSTHAIVFGQPSLPDPKDLLGVHTLDAMIAEAVTLFERAQERVDVLEQQVRDQLDHPD